MANTDYFISPISLLNDGVGYFPAGAQESGKAEEKGAGEYIARGEIEEPSGHKLN